MRDVVLEIKNLTRRFGTFTAVDALTLSVILLTTTIVDFIGA
jgi:ABC-type branched-subunit amino acid transport system ATPase component